MGENTAYAMAALEGRGMVEDRSWLERSIEGGCRVNANEPELPGEPTEGLEAIENNRGSGKVFNAIPDRYVTWADTKCRRD